MFINDMSDIIVRIRNAVQGGKNAIRGASQTTSTHILKQIREKEEAKRA